MPCDQFVIALFYEELNLVAIFCGIRRFDRLQTPLESGVAIGLSLRDLSIRPQESARCQTTVGLGVLLESDAHRPAERR